METLKEHISRPARSCNTRTEQRHLTDARFYPELRSWVQRAILEAEKSGNVEKKHQLLSLLKEL